MTNYARLVSPAGTPQSEPVLGTNQVQNNAGGYVFAVDDWTQLDRFLILGAEGGSYYASERKLVKENAESVLRAIAKDGVAVVNRVVEISKAGRAPKNDPALFVLALVATYGNQDAKQAAYAAFKDVARIGTHFLHLVDYISQLRSFGRGVKNGLARWYTESDPKWLAEQMVKYGQRDGWSQRDAIQQLHPVPPSPTHNALFAWVDEMWRRQRGRTPRDLDTLLRGMDADVREYLDAVITLKHTTEVPKAVALIMDFRLPREVVPTELLTNPEIWEALLPHMGIHAIIRSLPTMTRNGLLKPMSDAERFIRSKLQQGEILRKAKVHPVQVLTALLTYRSGHSIKGDSTWTPVTAVVDALDEAFYQTFEYIEPTGKRLVLALDVSGSMGSGVIAGVPGLTPRVAAAALAMVTARTEQQFVTVGFTAAANSVSRLYGNNAGISVLDISPRLRLDEVCHITDRQDFGGTDCALPMIWAKENKIDADAFVIYTDNETWAGKVHPFVALKQYRERSNIGAKLAVVGMTATQFSIADSSDAGMIDVVGMDTATPALLADFIRSGF